MYGLLLVFYSNFFPITHHFLRYVTLALGLFHVTYTLRRTVLKLGDGRVVPETMHNVLLDVWINSN